MLLLREKFVKIVGGVNTFGENNQFVFRIDVRRNKSVEILAKFVEFRVFIDVAPYITETF